MSRQLVDPESLSVKEDSSGHDDPEDIPDLPQRSLSTIEEEASEFLALSASTENSILKSRSSTSGPPSPPQLGNAVGAPRRVRFSLPDPIPWSSDDSDNGRGTDESGEEGEEKAPGLAPNTEVRQIDAWASWILNPLFDAPALCSTPAVDRSTSTQSPPNLPLDEDDGVVEFDNDDIAPSGWSRASSPGSMTPTLPSHTASAMSSDTRRRLESTSSLRRNRRDPLLGIEDRNRIVISSISLDDEEDDTLLLERRGEDDTRGFRSLLPVLPPPRDNVLEHQQPLSRDTSSSGGGTIVMNDQDIFQVVSDEDWPVSLNDDGMVEI